MMALVAGHRPSTDDANCRYGSSSSTRRTCTFDALRFWSEERISAMGAWATRRQVAAKTVVQRFGDRLFSTANPRIGMGAAWQTENGSLTRSERSHEACAVCPPFAESRRV